MDEDIQKNDVLIMKARHYQDASYFSSYDDPVCRAAIEQLDAQSADEYLNGLSIITITGEEKHFSHENYTLAMFNEDMESARQVEFDPSFIRKLELIRVEKPTKKGK